MANEKKKKLTVRMKRLVVAVTTSERTKRNSRTKTDKCKWRRVRGRV